MFLHPISRCICSSAVGNECEKGVVRESVDRMMWQGVKGWGGENKGGRATVQYSESKGSSGEGRDKERKRGKGGGWVRGHERWCVVAKQQLITKSPSILLVMPCPPSRPELHTVRFMFCYLSIQSKCWCSFNFKIKDRNWYFILIYFYLEQWSRRFYIFYKSWLMLKWAAHSHKFILIRQVWLMAFRFIGLLLYFADQILHYTYRIDITVSVVVIPVWDSFSACCHSYTTKMIENNCVFKDSKLSCPSRL